MSKLSKRAITLFIIATMLSAFIAVPVIAAPGDVDVVESAAYTDWSVYTSAAGIYSLHVLFPANVMANGLDVIATLDKAGLKRLEAHSPVGPSSGERWIHCPGSVLATIHLPDTQSERQTCRVAPKRG